MGAYFGVANLDRKYGFGVFGGRQVALGFYIKNAKARACASAIGP